MKTPIPEPVCESDAIRSNIEQTRESMDRTLDKISERMKPQHLLDEALDFVRAQTEGVDLQAQASAALDSVGQAASRAARGMVNVVRRHPIPTMLVGAAIAWAVLERRRARPDEPGEMSARELEQYEWTEAEKAQMTATSVLPEPSSEAEPGEKKVGEKLKEQGSKLAQRVSTGARVVGQKAQHSYQAGRDRIIEASDAHPLAMGVGFLAAGVLIGLLLPPSRQEDRMIGAVSDQAKAQAKARAQQLMEQGKHAMGAATEAAKKTGPQQDFSPPTTATTTGPKA
jgi:ElaB/YqjD/DUF883 family membrane-anchored ribosome-binding protein